MQVLSLHHPLPLLLIPIGLQTQGQLLTYMTSHRLWVQNYSPPSHAN